MERLKIILDSFENALKSLEDISNEPFTIIVRDATIQRFEYTFEVMWKSVKIFLREREGLDCYSPKACFRELQSVRKITITDTETLLEMADMRNLTSHTYIEQVAQDIYQRVNSLYLNVIKRVFEEIRKNL